MGLRIQQARSSIADKQPSPADLDFGELALNFNDGNPFLTTKDSNGVVRRLDRVEVSTSAPQNPTEGQLWFDIGTSSPGDLKVLQGGVWRGASGAAAIVEATTTTPGLVRIADPAAITAGTTGKVVDAAQLKAVEAKVSQPDWNAAAGAPGAILNKPAIPSAYVLPTASPTTLGGVRTATSTDIANGTAGRVVDAAQLKAVADANTGGLPVSGGTINGDLTVTGTITGDVTGDLTGNADTATIADGLSSRLSINGTEFDGTADVDITISTGPGGPVAGQPLTAGAYLAGPNYTGATAVTWDVEANTSPLPSTLVARDINGAAQASTFIGNLQGTADVAKTADALTAPVAINGIQFDGSADITIPVDAQPTPNALTPGLYLAGNDFDGSTAQTFDVVASTTAVPDTLIARDASGGATAITFNGSLNGNATTASSAAKLTTPVTINGVNFDGSQDITIAASPGGQAQLTPGLFLNGLAYDGSAPVRFDVDTREAEVPDSIPKRDSNADIRARRFIGDLDGNAATATTATTAQNATDATTAQTAIQATNATSADRATNADFATRAANADNATRADSALTADSTPLATRATNADNATQATTATSATTAQQADKLTTARTLWGQPFDGTANVGGPITATAVNGLSQLTNTLGAIFQLPAAGGTLVVDTGGGGPAPTFPNALEVGAYSWARNISGLNIPFNGAVFGSQIRIVRVNSTGSFTSSSNITPVGTWRNMATDCNDQAYSLFLRIL